MIPSKHARSLYFTPRTPWGRYPQNRPGQNYLRASEDEKRDLSAQPTYFERAMDNNNVPRSLQSMPPPGASDKTPAAKEQQFEPGRGRTRQGLPDMDYYEDSVNIQKKWDESGVPGRLQGQIIPQRAGEVTNPFRKPVPGLTDDVFPPPPQQTSPMKRGSEESIPQLTKEQMDEQARRWGGYQQAVPKPEQKFPEPPFDLYFGHGFIGGGKKFKWPGE